MSLVLATSFVQDQDFIRLLYIVAFVLFILGMRQVTGPTTPPSSTLRTSRTWCG